MFQNSRKKKTGPQSSYGGYRPGEDTGYDPNRDYSSAASNSAGSRRWDEDSSRGGTTGNDYAGSDDRYRDYRQETLSGDSGGSQYRHSIYAAEPPRRKRDRGWLKFLLAGLAALAALLLICLLLVPAIRERKSSKAAAADVTEALLENGQAAVSVYEEKILMVYPYLPEDYEDTSLAEITITDLDDTNLTFEGTFYEDWYYYVLEEGTYLVKLQWENGVTASAYVHIGEQGLYELSFTHI